MANRSLLTSIVVSFLSLQACKENADEIHSLEESVITEEVALSGGLDLMISMARHEARQKVRKSSLDDVDSLLRPHDTIYWPDGNGPFPAVLFFHGCSGRTLSHEADWAKRYNSIGIAMIAVDSYAGRDTNWEDACNIKTLLPWERAKDVLSTINFARNHENIISDSLHLSGFSHGAMTVWATLAFASTKTPPIGLDKWPHQGIDGVKSAFLFYGSCIDSWNVNIDTTMFLGRDDQYIDETSCEAYRQAHSESAGPFDVIIFNNATHTFDHAKPNASNIAAGSRYDRAATETSWRRIQDVINKD